VRKIPIIATLFVLAAVTVMIALGVWQLGRMAQKEALLTRYAAAQTMSSEAEWPQNPAGFDDVLFRHARIDCQSVGSDRPMSGRNADGQAGWAHVFACDLGEGRNADVVMGWSKQPTLLKWDGGELGGVIAPGGRLVADQPLPGLEASARPDPRDVPNNHWSYAVQWFLFALTALVIYTLALRKRLAAKDGAG
jgi:surfeit locus 1 family protein